MLASGVAVLVWFGLYKFIYKQSFSPGLPGEGLFKYVVWKDPVNNLVKNRVASKNKASENKWSSKVSIIGRENGLCKETITIDMLFHVLIIMS